MSVYDRVSVALQTAICQKIQIAIQLQSNVSSAVRSNDDVRVECRILKLFQLLVCGIQTIVVDDIYVGYIVSVIRN